MKVLAGLMMAFCTLNLLVAIGRAMQPMSNDGMAVLGVIYLVVPIIVLAVTIHYAPNPSSAAAQSTNKEE